MEKLFQLFCVFLILFTVVDNAHAGVGWSSVSSAYHSAAQSITAGGRVPKGQLLKNADGSYTVNLYSAAGNCGGSPTTVEGSFVYDETFSNPPGQGTPPEMDIQYFTDGHCTVVTSSTWNITAWGTLIAINVSRSGFWDWPSGTLATAMGYNPDSSASIGTSTSAIFTGQLGSYAVYQCKSSTTLDSTYSFTLPTGCDNVQVQYLSATNPQTNAQVGAAISVPCASAPCLDVPGWINNGSSADNQSWVSTTGHKWRIVYNSATGCDDVYRDGKLDNSVANYTYDPTKDFLDTSGDSQSGGGMGADSSQPDPRNPANQDRGFGNISSANGLGRLSGYTSIRVKAYLNRTSVLLTVPKFKNITAFASFANLSSTSSPWSGYKNNGETGEPYWKSQLSDIKTQFGKLFPVATIGGDMSALFSAASTPIEPTSPIHVPSPLNWDFDPLKASCDMLAPLMPFVHGFWYFVFTGGFLWACWQVIVKR